MEAIPFAVGNKIYYCKIDNQLRNTQFNTYNIRPSPIIVFNPSLERGSVEAILYHPETNMEVSVGFSQGNFTYLCN
jgi:hypothetical protein